MKSLCFVFFLFVGTVISQPIRYIDSLFSQTQTHTNRVYASAPQLNSPYTGESFTHNTDLKMHIFQPAGDTVNKRPILICAHSGGFFSGNKEHDDMMTFCRIFASKGYVTATIQYRLGMNVASSVSGERAVYRGLQDGRAAIRFIKGNSSVLKVDTNKIFFLGSSAGAFVGLHNVFMNKTSERPASSFAINNFPPTSDNGPDLGGYDAIASSYQFGAHPKALIALWGALKDTVLIEQSDSSTTILLIHGTSDFIVPFEVGRPFNAPSFPPTYGSSPIKKRLVTLNLRNESYFVPGAGHEFYGAVNGMWSPAPNAYWDTVVNKVTTFLYKYLDIPTRVEDETLVQSFSLSQNYPNPFNPTTRIRFAVGESVGSCQHVILKVYDAFGRELTTLVDEIKEPGNYETELNTYKLGLTSGIYFYRMIAGKYSQTKKMLLIR